MDDLYLSIINTLDLEEKRRFAEVNFDGSDRVDSKESFKMRVITISLKNTYINRNEILHHRESI